MMGTQIRSILYLGIICLSACSRLEEAEREKLRQRNCTSAPIYRSEHEIFYSIASPIHTPRARYSWESEGNFPRITKEFFRCKGNPVNPQMTDTGEAAPRFDCEGSSRHGLPIIYGQEGVFPILTDLLNFVQKKTGKRVIVTCGHRCPVHNSYSDPSKENRTSKHQIGAEVDFYVQGMENQPLEIVGLLMQFYVENPLYRGDKEYVSFQRYDKADARVSVCPWMNKEVFLKVYQADEGRDGDNRHPYPYISIQVRFDKKRGERVVYDWAKANKGYPRE